MPTESDREPGPLNAPNRIVLPLCPPLQAPPLLVGITHYAEAETSSVAPIGQPASDESFEVAANSSSFSRAAMAFSSSGERLAHCSGGKDWDQAMDSGLVRSGMTANFLRVR